PAAHATALTLGVVLSALLLAVLEARHYSAHLGWSALGLSSSNRIVLMSVVLAKTLWVLLPPLVATGLLCRKSPRAAAVLLAVAAVMAPFASSPVALIQLSAALPSPVLLASAKAAPSGELQAVLDLEARRTFDVRAARIAAAKPPGTPVALGGSHPDIVV